MSAPSSLSCERCDELLTDLVCGELDHEQVALVRGHAAQCDRCGPALAQLERVMQVAHELPLDEPSPHVMQHVMQAAREAVPVRGGPAEPVESAEPSSGFKAWLARLADWAMSPQVAMASVLVLVVGIGLYALPLGRDASEPVSLEAADEATPSPAPSASATAVPAAQGAAPAPEATAEDAANEERLSSRMGGGSAAEAPADMARTEGRAASRSRASGGVGSLSASKPAMNRADGFEGDPYANAPAAEKAFPAASAPARKKTAEPKKGANAPGGSIALDDFEGAPPPAPAAPSAAAPREAEAPLTKEEQASAPGAAMETQLRDGVAAAQRGDAKQAIALLLPIVDKGPASLKPQARLWLARSFRAVGECERALVYYRGIVASSSASAAVLGEAADCYERTGDTAEATALRSRMSTRAKNTADVADE